MVLKIFTFLSAAFLTLFIAWGLGWLWFATNVALAHPEKPEVKTEAIVVLTGGSGRITEGLNLLADRAAPKLFISGVNKGVSEDDILKAWNSRAPKIPCCIYLGYEAENTAGNAREVQKWVEKNKIKSLRLVTSSYHMPRANMEVSKKLPEIKIFHHPVISDDFEAWKGRFWPLTFEEYHKILFIWLGLGNTQQILDP